jgi:hypothetical protein
MIESFYFRYLFFMRVGSSTTCRYDTEHNGVFNTFGLKTSEIASEHDLQHVPTQRNVQWI